ncbi:hypothetical protein [Mariniphaga sp.]|uniref:DUF7670 domain-containing protein n=1 Tax=Mariniphaga sp. TaxID=1954475 RepID=UPI00356A82E1
MKSKSNKTLQIITSIYAVLYFALIANAYIKGYVSFSNLNHNLQLVLLLIFLLGFILSWTSKKMAGIMLMIWNAGVWILALYFEKGDNDSPMAGVMATPIMVFGAIFLLEWYKTTKSTMLSEKQQWKYVLRVLLINYAVLYGIAVFSDLSYGKGVDYFSLPYIIFPLLLLIFLVGFLLSWKREFYAGFIFLFWCVVYLCFAIAYTEILQAGPWIIFGIPILFQGIFYIKNHYEFRTK